MNVKHKTYIYKRSDIMLKQPLDLSLSFDPYAGEPNRDGLQGAEYLADGAVKFRIIAKDAKE
ncbi:MAG: hypothetical protein CW338_12040, partial [Clostridiales bacterium]|nr:hypothetical protein [Clostridiales bacterium]